MSLLTPEELAQLNDAESLFPSPIPVQSLSSDEFMPSPQSPQQREFETRVKDMGARLAKEHNLSRRQFFKTAGGMAAAFLAMNETYAKQYMSPEQIDDVDLSKIPGYVPPPAH